MPDGGNVRSAVSGWEPIATPPRKSVVEKWVPILDEKKFVGKNAVIKYVDLEENESGKTLRAQVYDMGRDFATEQFGLSEEFKTQVPEMPQWLNDDEIAVLSKAAKSDGRECVFFYIPPRSVMSKRPAERELFQAFYDNSSPGETSVTMDCWYRAEVDDQGKVRTLYQLIEDTD